MTPRIGRRAFGSSRCRPRTPAPFRAPNEADRAPRGARAARAAERSWSTSPIASSICRKWPAVTCNPRAERWSTTSPNSRARSCASTCAPPCTAFSPATSRASAARSRSVSTATRKRVYLQARPLSGDANASRSAIVFFFEGEALGDWPATQRIEDGAPSEQIQQLQQELQFTQSQLRTSREEYEGANEELRAANEELQSINEEYRSTAEELETSKEELQSINEELQTVNAELKTKLESVSRAHSDIQNLMAATDVGILFLDTQLRIKRFTPRIAELFNVAAGDEGRSITDFTHSLDYDDLAADARTVLRDLASIEREVRSAERRLVPDADAALPDGRGQDRRRRRHFRRHRRAPARRGRAARQRSAHARGHRRRGRRDRHHRRARDDPVAQRGHDDDVRLFRRRTHRAQRQGARAGAPPFAARRLHPALSPTGEAKIIGVSREVEARARTVPRSR